MPDTSDIITGQAQTRLQSIVSRIERLNEDKAKLSEEEAMIELYMNAIDGYQPDMFEVDAA